MSNRVMVILCPWATVICTSWEATAKQSLLPVLLPSPLQNLIVDRCLSNPPGSRTDTWNGSDDVT